MELHLAAVSQYSWRLLKHSLRDFGETATLTLETLQMESIIEMVKGDAIEDIAGDSFLWCYEYCMFKLHGSCAVFSSIFSLSSTVLGQSHHAHYRGSAHIAPIIVLHKGRGYIIALELYIVAVVPQNIHVCSHSFTGLPFRKPATENFIW